MNNSFFPIILGSDENAYAVARCFNDEYGIVSLCLCSRALAQTSKSGILTVKPIKDFDTPAVFVDALLKELRSRENMGKLVVVPCADYYTELLVKNYDSFEGRIANRFISPELFERIGTKDGFYKLCDENGIYYPDTVICEYDERLTLTDRLPFDFPIIVKPENSNATEYLKCSFEGKRKAYFLKSKDEYVSVVTAMNKSGYKGKLIVQRLIKGGDTTSFVINSYSGMDGKVRLSCIGRILLEEYAPSMLGNYAGIITADIPELYAEVKRLLDSIGFVGFSNIDVKYDAETGKYCFFEINPRQGRSSYYVKAAGYDLMKEMVLDVVNGEKRENTVYGNNEIVWSSVPKRVLFSHITDTDVKKRARAAVESKGIAYTLKNRKEKDAIRYLRLYKMTANKVKSIKQYYFDKNELGK